VSGIATHLSEGELSAGTDWLAFMKEGMDRNSVSIALTDARADGIGESL
jgi:hypothetical protein